MEGDGALQNWLWQTGKDIGRAVGPHLKKAAKEKALAYAQEHLGSGLADELGSAAKSVGSAALGSASENLAGITDVASAKKAAKSVGQAAVDAGKSQLKKLSDKYFGGAGTPQQAVRVCAYTLSSLRKVVTRYRRDLAKTPVNDFLMMHAKRVLASNTVKIPGKDMGEKLERFTHYVHTSPRRDGYSMKEKRKLVARIRKGLHPPVSKMSREQIIQYIYGTAKEQNVNWEPYFDGAMQKKRVPKSCYRMSGPGQKEYTPQASRPRKAPSAYNKFVQLHMTTYQFPEGMEQKAKMKEIGRLWKQEKESIANEEHARAVTLEDIAASRPMREKLKKAGKIPKKGQDKDLELDFDDSPAVQGPPGAWSSRTKRRRRQLK
eukprot:COSAG04_NODE_63_length_30038_cov_9.461071_17_plen_376_part_00